MCIIEEVLAPKASFKLSLDTVGTTKATKILVYDPLGRMIEETSHGEDGCVATQYLTQYGPDQLVTKQIVRYFGPSKEPDEVTTYFYDSQGRRERSETRNKGGHLLDSLTIRYGPDGTREDSLFDAKGKLESTVVTHFNKAGKPVKEEWYTHGKLRQATLTSYNTRGLKETVEFLAGPDKQPYQRMIYAYNEKGQPSDVTFRQPTGLILKRIRYSYSHSGHIETVSYYQGRDKLQEWDSLVCDSHGNWVVFSKYHTHPDPSKAPQKPYEQMVRRIYYYCTH